MSDLQDALDWWDTMLMDPEGHEPMPVPEGKGKHIHAFVDAARRVANGEPLWICWYPEFGDPGCLEEHDPEKTRQPRKHGECQWVLALDINK